MAIFIAGAATARGEEAGDIVLSIRKPISFLLITPTGNIGSTSSSEIIRIVSELMTHHTDLEVAQLDPALVGDCKGRLACFVRKLGAERRSESAPSMMLVLSILTQEGATDRLSVALVDVLRAQELEIEANKTEDDWETELEARIFESAVLARPKLATLANEEETRSFLRSLFEADLQRA